MPKPFRVLLAAAIAFAVALPAAAQTEDFVPVLTEERTYLLCAGSNKVQNGGPVAWDTTAPSTSYTAGAGCGFADTGESDEELKPVLGDDPTGELELAGTYTGNLDSLSVHLHAIDGPWTRSELFGMEVVTSVTIDGQEVYSSGDGLDLPYTRSDSGATIFGQYTITDIGLVEESDLTDHEVVVRMNALYSDDLYGWVWGATEIDSGLTFNPSKVAGARVRARR